MSTQIQVPEWNPRKNKDKDGEIGKNPDDTGTRENIWEMREDENAKQYQAFRAYVDLGPDRTLKQVAEETDYKNSYVEKLSKTRAWVDRANAYQNHLGKVETESKKEQIRKAYEKLYANLPDLIEAALDKAIDDNNTRMIRDLLDRTLGDAEKHLHEFSDNDDENVEDVLERAFEN